MKKQLFIYRIRHVETGRSYIGWTVDPDRRWRRHQCLARAGSKNAIHGALRLHGVNSFKFEIVESLIGSEAEARTSEIRWIADEGTLIPNGYNMTAGGDGAEDLGRLAAAAIAKLKAADPEGFKAKRAEAQRVANAAMQLGARSEGARRMWANRAPEMTRRIGAASAARMAALSGDERAERARRAAMSGTAQERSERARQAARNLSEVQRRASVVAMHAGWKALTREERSALGREAAAAKNAKTTPEERSAAVAKRWRDTSSEVRERISAKHRATRAAMSAERKSEIAQKIWATRRARAQQPDKQLE